MDRLYKPFEKAFESSLTWLVEDQWDCRDIRNRAALGGSLWSLIGREQLQGCFYKKLDWAVLTRKETADSSSIWWDRQLACILSSNTTSTPSVCSIQYYELEVEHHALGSFSETRTRYITSFDIRSLWPPNYMTSWRRPVRYQKTVLMVLLAFTSFYVQDESTSIRRRYVVIFRIKLSLIHHVFLPAISDCLAEGDNFKDNFQFVQQNVNNIFCSSKIIIILRSPPNYILR